MRSDSNQCSLFTREDSFDVSDSESEGEQELEVTTLESMNVNELTTELKKLRKERQEMLAIVTVSHEKLTVYSFRYALSYGID